MPDRFRVHRAAIVCALLTTAGCMPAPSPNEVNFSDEGMSQGVASASRSAARGEIDNVAIGKSMNDDKTIRDRTRDFQPSDTIYLSLRVLGSANSGIVRAVWFDPQGQPVHQETRIVSPSRGETIAMQASRPNGWRPGAGTLEVFLDDRLTHTESYRVAGGDRRPGQQGLDKPAH
jgi:hypothetical protein